jgi:type I restriction enzyme, S subunit
MKYKLKDLCSITKGAIGIMKADGGKYPLVALSDERRSHSEFQFDAKAVIVPLISSTGHGHASMKRVHYQEGKFALGNILCAVIPNDEMQLNAKYLHLYLQQFKETLLVPLMKGAANVSLPMNKLADVEIEVPSLERQLEIIELEEEAAEYKNELEERLIAQDGDVAKLRQAILKEAMQGKLTKQDTKDGNAKDLLEKIKTEKEKLIAEKKLKKEKELPPIKELEIPFEIPKNWLWCRLGEICNYGSSPKAEPKHITEKTWVLDLEDIEKDTSRLLCKVRFAERNSLSTKSIFRKGEVLYSKLRPYLDKVIVADEDGVCTTEILPLNFYGEINPYFLRFALKRSDFLSYVNSVTKGMKMPRLGTIQGQKALVPLPPIAEQNRIVIKLEQLMKYCDELQYSIQQSKIENEKLLQGALRDALKKEEMAV